jgi:von Willebrand factor type A domain
MTVPRPSFSLSAMRVPTWLALASALALALPAAAEAPSVARPHYGAGRDDHSGGTVFFLELEPAGVVAVGAAHSFDFAELARAGTVEFQLGRTRQRAGVSSRLLAPPGLSFATPGGSLRSDLAVFALDAPAAGVTPLRPGKRPEPGERVQVLGIPPLIPRDQDDLFGTVREASDDRLEIDLDVVYDLRGWGGAPVVTRDGLVVGVLEAAWPKEGSLRVAAAPIAAVLEAVRTPLAGGEGAPFERFAQVGQPDGETATAPGIAPTAEPGPAGAGVQVAARPPTQPSPPPRPPLRTEPTPEPDRKALVDAQELIAKERPLLLEVEYPQEGAVLGDQLGAFVAGRAIAPVGDFRRLDVVFVIDTSFSTVDPSGSDINGNGVVGKATPGSLGSLFGLGEVDPGDSILAAEVASARHFLDRLDPRNTRVGIVTFAGEPVGDGFSTRVLNAAVTAVPLTTEYDEVHAGLDQILRQGPAGSTHMAAGVDQATVELLGLRGARSRPDPRSEKIVIFLTDGQPTLPYPSYNESGNVQAVLRAAERSHRAGVRVYSFGIGPEALAGPIAIVRLAEITGGVFTPVRDPASLLDVVEEIDFANIESLTVRNATLDQPAFEVSLNADGSWGSLVPLAAGHNDLVVHAHATDGREAEVHVQVNYAPDAPSPQVPAALLARRNRLLEQRLVSLKRGRVEIEKNRVEEARRELLIEIERERRRAAVETERQRKELELEVERSPAPTAEPTPGP